MTTQSLEADIERVVASTRTRVPHWVSEHARRSDDAYCLCLAYNHAGDAVLAPSIAVRYESTRVRRARSLTLEEHADVYLAPAEMEEVFDDLPAIYGSDVVELEHRIEKAILEDDDTDHEDLLAIRRRPLLRVVRDLSGLDWSQMLSVTDDFFVLAADFQQYHTCSNLRATNPSVHASLRESGLLPEEFEWASIDLGSG